jgi:hypothetical protein
MPRPRCPALLVAACLALPWPSSTHAQPAAVESRIVVQSSPIAGFRYHDAASVFESMRVGDALALVREPDNPHDPNAIRVEWNGRTLGYVPRTENARVARQLDQDIRLTARVSRLQRHRNPRERIEFEIHAPL